MIIINTESVAETMADVTTEANVVDVIVEKAEETASVFTKISGILNEKLPSILFALIVLVIGIIISKLVLKLTEKMIIKASVDKTANGFLHSFIAVVLYSFVIILALNILGVPMASIITVVGAAGLALSLALQQCLSNVAGGLIILFSKPFKVGDFIEVNGTSGVVEGITILYTRILTVDHKLSYIPNGTAANEKIINYTTMQTRRLDLVYSISYDSNFKDAQRIINNIISQSELAIVSPEPIVRMSGHGSSSIDIDVKVWVKSDDYFQLKYELNETIKEAFDKEGINIPYTTVDVNLKK